MTCKKVTTIAIIESKGRLFIGTNWCHKPQNGCPRDALEMKTGKGYHLCKEICQQDMHAEMDALRVAGGRAREGIMYLFGHYYVCEPCLQACANAGIVKIQIGGIPKIFMEYLNKKEPKLTSLSYMSGAWVTDSC